MALTHWLEDGQKKETNKEKRGSDGFDVEEPARIYTELQVSHSSFFTSGVYVLLASLFKDYIIEQRLSLTRVMQGNYLGWIPWHAKQRKTACLCALSPP